MEDVEIRQSALEQDQQRLRLDVQEEIAPLIAKLEEFKQVVQINHEHVMSAWDDLTDRLSELASDHKKFHKPGNGSM